MQCISRWILRGILFLSLIFSGVSAFAEKKIIKLKDGVILCGEVISKEGEFYRIATKTVGTLLVRDSDILSIEAATSQEAAKKVLGTTFDKIDLPPEVRSYEKNIINNPDVMQSLQALSKDEELLELLNDPSIRKAILNLDVEFLRNNEKFQKFMDNAQLKKTIAEIKMPYPKINKSEEEGSYGRKN